MESENKDILRRQFSNEQMTRRYQSAVKYFTEGMQDENGMDETEYKVFQETLIKPDLAAAAHAYFNRILTFEEYFIILQAIIGYALMIRGIMDGTVKQKSDGKTE